MSSPFTIGTAEATPFVPRQKGSTMNIREQFVHFVHQQGWVLDTEATVTLRRGEVVQDPLAFTRPAADGTTWHLRLDYQVEDSWSYRTDNYRTDNTLRGLELWRTDAEGNRVGARRYRLVNTAVKKNDPDRLWEVTGRNTDHLNMSSGGNLRRRAERVVESPELCLWLAAEEDYLERERYRQRQVAREEKEKARRRRNPALAVSNQDFARLASDVRSVLYTLSYTDGETDVVSAMERLRVAVKAMEAGLK